VVGCLALRGQGLTLTEAVRMAAANYPSIQVSQEQVNAAAAAIDLARTAYLPRVEGIAQVNRATRNNVFGLILPQSVIPSISGPVLGTNNLGSAWGSAIGGLVTWEPFDFGFRKAGVGAAETARNLSEATVKRTEFEVTSATIGSYLTLGAAEQAQRAAQAGVDRAGTVLQSTQAVVNAQLRPGADASRAEAEVAAARTQVAQAQQAVEIAKALLGQLTGSAITSIAGARLLTLPAEQPASEGVLAANPFVAEQNASVEQARAQLRILERSYFPKFALQGAAYSRGTGDELNGTRLGALNGLAPNVQNYALGFSVTFVVSDFVALRAKEAAQSANIRAQTAKAKQLVTDLQARWNAALAELRGARAVAANTPTEVTSARAAFAQSNARYQAGLGTIAEVADAQRLLTQAEIDDSLSHLSVWRALFDLAAAAGDLQPFLAEAGK
jgi:outer membrane protein TolC